MRVVTAASLCVAGMLAVTASANPPSMSSRWGRTQLAQNACLSNAERAIRAAGFEGRAPTQTTRYGVRGEYVVAIRCVTDLGMYFMFSAGPTQNNTDANVEAVDKGF